MTFITYSIIGWLWESVYCSFKARHFVYRGFLLGPYCPVYGFGVTAVLLLVPDKSGTLLNLYFNSVVIVTIIEYLTSWLLEKLFNMSLWDYKSVPLNIEGRVAVPVSMFWGVGCLFLIKVINPVIQDGINQFSNMTHSIGPILLFIVFITDVVTTLSFTATTKKEVAASIDTSDSENASIKEYRLKRLFENEESDHNRLKVLHELRKKPLKLRHHNLNRLLKNYPNLKLKK
ncbi:putative ABC transporter permease [Vagococcus bubulae]|uniref:ABC transporter permease n=1 Tax=Vagococcus bubulae TaxID=1977868 RepID=A0A429ZGP3_9ENTE|nr:hypothetical protein [Vagococcus bubulae]RST92845.1 hypothetical protein CBF36_08195 [Vagococcus bubulae]